MRTMVWMVLAALAVGCAGNDTAKLQDDVDALTKRVSSLEQKVKRLEGGGKAKGGKAKGGKAKGGKSAKGKSAKGKTDKAKGGKTDKAKTDKPKTDKAAKSGPKGTLKVGGDAVKVMVADDSRKWAVPNTLPPNTYTMLAAFGAETTLAEFGTFELKADETYTIECKSELRTCVALPLATPQ